MKKFLLVLVLFALPLLAAVHRMDFDLKLPTQVILEKQTVSAPAAASATLLSSAYAGATSAATVTLSTFSAQPGVPRNIVITPGGTTADVASCTIVVNGTNFFGASISENFVFSNDASAATTGAKAFKTVTSVVFPANCEDGGFAATWDIGTGTKLGLGRCMANAGSFFQAAFNGTRESTFATIAASATAVESNTASLNTTLNGSDVDLYYVQNFRCLP